MYLYLTNNYVLLHSKLIFVRLRFAKMTHSAEIFLVKYANERVSQYSLNLILLCARV